MDAISLKVKNPLKEKKTFYLVAFGKKRKELRED